MALWELNPYVLGLWIQVCLYLKSPYVEMGKSLRIQKQDIQVEPERKCWNPWRKNGHGDSG